MVIFLSLTHSLWADDAVFVLRDDKIFDLYGTITQARIPELRRKRDSEMKNI